MKKILFFLFFAAPAFAATHKLPLVNAYCYKDVDHQVMIANFTDNVRQYTGQFIGDKTSFCTAQPLTALTLTQDKICKVSICCHWTQVNPNPYVYVDDNSMPASAPFHVYPGFDNQNAPVQ